ncbi:hypothetical protein NSA53_17320 [Cellulosimicrobium cellulans]|uniref:hypothetical protein n=1 Tax=Cellulosimicrobium cellulans TaxID=1710 RepID=UPI00214A2D56|nr:hypothetical protein [Cellulosimicrobium cellulans]
MTGPNTVTISATEHDALLAIERAANVLAAGDLVDPEEAAKVRDALPHLLEDLALTRPVTSPITALAARLPRRFAERGIPSEEDAAAVYGASLPELSRFRSQVSDGIHEARAQEQWVAEMAAQGALTPEHRAAYRALVDAGVQPHQLRFLATAIVCGGADPTTEKGQPS